MSRPGEGGARVKKRETRKKTGGGIDNLCLTRQGCQVEHRPSDELHNETRPHFGFWKFWIMSSGAAAVAVGAGVLGLLWWGRRWRRQEKAPTTRRVFIIGGTKGIGAALAKQLREHGDMVIVAGRHPHSGSFDEVLCDVRDADSISTAFSMAQERMGGAPIDIVLNMAAVSQPETGSLATVETDDLAAIINTNVLGTLLVAKEAQKQKVSHLILVGGAGTRRYMSTPNHCAYGFSKAGFVQLQKSLVSEFGTQMAVHLMVPGMAITDLLNAKQKSKEVRRIFNILAESPETMAAFFVPKIRGLSGLKPQQWDYLTAPSVAWRFLTSYWRRNRLIDERSGEIIKV